VNLKLPSLIDLRQQYIVVGLICVDLFYDFNYNLILFIFEILVLSLVGLKLFRPAEVARMLTSVLKFYFLYFY
jgi:hypothetical protein